MAIIFMWLLLIILSTTISFLLLIIGVLVGKKLHHSLAHSSPFECGFPPQTEAKSPISLKFFIIALVFLVFDTELILMFPFMLGHPTYLLKMLVFLSLLIFLSLGLVYEWVTSMLEWLS